MLVGYARTSTLDQIAGLEAQKRELETLGCEKLFIEQTSSVGARQELERAMEFVRQGDTLAVTKLDRLARSVRHLGEIVEVLEKKGVALRILNLGVDTNTSTGRLMLNMLGAVAQFEREMMLERQREGVAKAKAEGKYKGRKPTARNHTTQILHMLASGASKSGIARHLGISERSVYRSIALAGKESGSKCPS